MMKLFAALVALAAVAVGVAMVVGGRVPVADNRTIVPMTIASPADSFVVHDAAPATPAAPPATPAPVTPDGSTPSALDAAIARLRATSPASAPDAPATPPGVGPTPDTSLAGPGSAPIIQAAPTTPPVVPATPASPPPPPPPPTWTSVTSQGARWRTGRDLLVIDMGGGRTATVHVEPAFLALSPDAANARVDFLKQTILEAFPTGSTQFRFARDGSVTMLR
jgi:hypothetical protein